MLLDAATIRKPGAGLGSGVSGVGGGGCGCWRHGQTLLRLLCLLWVQCDLLRPLRLPGILVGDGRLGGISATISALDTLALRGYEVGCPGC